MELKFCFLTGSFCILLFIGDFHRNIPSVFNVDFLSLHFSFRMKAYNCLKVGGTKRIIIIALAWINNNSIVGLSISGSSGGENRCIPAH